MIKPPSAGKKHAKATAHIKHERMSDLGNGRPQTLRGMGATPGWMGRSNRSTCGPQSSKIEFRRKKGAKAMVQIGKEGIALELVTRSSGSVSFVGGTGF